MSLKLWISLDRRPRPPGSELLAHGVARCANVRTWMCTASAACAHSIKWYAPTYPTEFGTRFKRLRNAQHSARRSGGPMQYTIHVYHSDTSTTDRAIAIVVLVLGTGVAYQRPWEE
eukprot:2904990-Rhodomonas_salina.1